MQKMLDLCRPHFIAHLAIYGSRAFRRDGNTSYHAVDAAARLWITSLAYDSPLRFFSASLHNIGSRKNNLLFRRYSTDHHRPVFGPSGPS